VIRDGITYSRLMVDSSPTVISTEYRPSHDQLALVRDLTEKIHAAAVLIQSQSVSLGEFHVQRKPEGTRAYAYVAFS
jgi:hypothetical protein